MSVPSKVHQSDIVAEGYPRFHFLRQLVVNIFSGHPTGDPLPLYGGTAPKLRVAVSATAVYTCCSYLLYSLVNTSEMVYEC